MADYARVLREKASNPRHTHYVMSCRTLRGAAREIEELRDLLHRVRACFDDSLCEGDLVDQIDTALGRKSQ